MKNQKGITLIALVVTIIVLIVLAGISINLLFGQNSLIEKAKQSGNRYIESANEEEKSLSTLDIIIDEYLDVKNEVTIEEAKNENMYNRRKNTKYIDNTRSINNEVTIPAGFRITEDTDKIDEGIVIEDESGNQWVWIPVDNPEELYDELETPAQLGNTGVYTTLKSKSEIIPDKTRTNIGNTGGYREPDMATYYDNNSRLPVAGFESTETKEATVLFAEDLVSTYYNMIQSLKKYGGFYIGRFELSGSESAPTLKKDKAIYAYGSWYSCYKVCSSFTTSTATSRMIWGCLWDEVCLFISERGNVDDRVNFSESASFGNYGSGLKTTGFRDNWKVRNIYDLAGNAWEWTQDAWSNVGRSANGGGNSTDAETWPVTARKNIASYGTGGSITSRPVLYLNP